ncbi:MAG: BlaI/MecI/CopY family transcriptional regulator [Ignavibacteria bacterium]|nr:BlaI/MecI/CopY family transcriptional regulator [Ignavibacteria bacterium]MCU7503683.1 BlaI/MecI/CopY family transcriptional regulator [Ignavibacteria bacterium]MCU7517670.1 BlaI/MecI/CopY family transcriptional regulator [Ignavibacteria bacterium]
MKEMTKAEEQIMQILWKLGKGFVNDIIKELPEPRPAYTTVSTIVRILEKKGFVSHKAYGNTHEYYPLVTKENYTKDHLKGFLKGYFSNSFAGMVSFFSKEEDLDVSEMEEIMKMLQKEIKAKKESEIKKKTK